MQKTQRFFLEIYYIDSISSLIYISNLVGVLGIPDIQAEQLYVILKNRGKVEFTFSESEDDETMANKSKRLNKIGIENKIISYD
jgi:hypothetical protein